MDHSQHEQYRDESAWVDFQKEAQQIVESKVLWKKFIAGTPLANDISCWMTDFALKNTAPQRTWVGLTQNELTMICDSMKTWSSFTVTDVYFAIEAKLKEKNT